MKKTKSISEIPTQSLIEELVRRNVQMDGKQLLDYKTMFLENRIKDVEKNCDIYRIILFVLWLVMTITPTISRLLKPIINIFNSVN